MDKNNLLGQNSMKYINTLSETEKIEISKDLLLMEKILSNNGRVIGLFGNDVIANKKLVKIALSNAGNAIRFCGEEFQKSKELAKISVKNMGKAIQYYSDEIKGDRDIGLAAVKQDGMSLSYLSDELKGDKEIVIAAINNDDRAIQWASFDMKKDIDICILAVKNNANNIYHIHESAQNNLNVFLAALKNDISIMKKESSDGKTFYFSDEVRLHHEAAKVLIKQHPDVICDYAIPKTVFVDKECIFDVQEFLEDINNKERYKDNTGFLEATAALMRIKREDELNKKLADLDKIQAQQQNSINHHKVEVKARRKI